MDYQKISVSLIGNATKDAAVKKAKESGNVYGDFTVAVRDRQKETHFFPVRCFGKLAEQRSDPTGTDRALHDLRGGPRRL